MSMKQKGRRRRKREINWFASAPPSAARWGRPGCGCPPRGTPASKKAQQTSTPGHVLDSVTDAGLFVQPGQARHAFQPDLLFTAWQVKRPSMPVRRPRIRW